MKTILQSKILAVAIMLFVIIFIIATFKHRTQWWMFIDIFFAFMMSFLHLISLMFAKLNAFISKRLSIIARICGAIFIVSFLIEYVVR